jgi:hypothetical protein
MKSFNTPIVLIIYKRTQTLLKIIDELRKINASKIYVIADGPKSEKDITLINEARLAIETIDWKTEVTKLYSVVNKGLYKNITEGLDYVFTVEDKAIILEDDCIPNNSFFIYESEMLDRYKKTPLVALVSGNNLGLKMKFDYDYDFTRYALIWGWGTWKKSWTDFRKEIPMIIEAGDRAQITALFNNRASIFHWNKIIDRIYKGQHSSWAHEFTYYLLYSKKLCIIPKNNMVSNQGIDQVATHTKSNTPYFFSSLTDYSFPLTHPIEEIENRIISNTIEKKVFGGGLTSYLSYLVQSLFRVLK